MGYNLPLLRKERDWVAEQRSLPYSQSQLAMDWWYLDTPGTLEELGKECGTTYCIAGHIAATTPGVEWRIGGDVEVCSSGLYVNGKRRDIAVWAGEQLGLSYDDASYLFNSSDDDVLDVLDELIAAAEAAERGQ